MQTYHYIFYRGHFSKQPQILERAPDPRHRPEIRRHRAKILTVENYCTARLAYVAGNQIEEGGFAGAVWSYKTMHVASFDREINVSDCDQAAEPA
jgi:hypothetical protein